MAGVPLYVGRQPRAKPEKKPDKPKKPKKDAMTQYYALEGVAKGNSVRVVIHLQVPSGNNAAGVPWVSVAADFKLARTGTLTSRVPPSLLEAGAQAALDAGTLYEVEFNVRDNKNAPEGVRLTRLEEAVVGEVAVQLVNLENQLDFYGYKGAVA